MISAPRISAEIDNDFANQCQPILYGTFSMKLAIMEEQPLERLKHLN